MRRAQVLVLFVSCLLYFVSLPGCSPTYPKEKFADSIVRLCKTEYKLDVKAATAGNTVVIYVPLQDLWDLTFSLTIRAGEEINDVILSVSRVALSTDAKSKASLPKDPGSNWKRQEHYERGPVDLCD